MFTEMELDGKQARLRYDHHAVQVAYTIRAISQSREEEKLAGLMSSELQSDILLLLEAMQTPGKNTFERCGRYESRKGEKEARKSPRENPYVRYVYLSTAIKSLFRTT